MKVLTVFGTRPEAIKLAPLIRRLKRQESITCMVCNTGQHDDLLTPILDFFKIHLDISLQVMHPGQSLHQLTSKLISSLELAFKKIRPDYVIVHGDTTTSFVAALAAYYSNIRIAHVEAGLRTHNKYAPFPEEINRTLTASIADLHFAPTTLSKNNLLAEGKKESSIIVTGNTVIDALFDAVELIDEDVEEIKALKNRLNLNQRIILFTGHRRENFAAGFDEIFDGLLEIANRHRDVQIIYPVHPNPNVHDKAYQTLASRENIFLIKPLTYGPFVWLMKQSYIILTDSGGIQEEAPSLGKPVLVLRDVTERPEAVKAGTVILVGTNKEKIVSKTSELLMDNSFYNKMSRRVNPYGDGKASDRIVEYFLNNQN